MNTNQYDVQSTIFFCSSYQTGFRVLEEWKSNSDLRTLFTSVYKHVHFIPINEFGVQLLQILTIPHWNERLLRLFFKNEYRSFGMGDMPYDAQLIDESTENIIYDIATSTNKGTAVSSVTKDDRGGETP